MYIHMFKCLFVCMETIKIIFCIVYRSSGSQMFFKLGVVRNIPIFTVKHLSWSLLLIKLKAQGDSSTSFFL